MILHLTPSSTHQVKLYITLVLGFVSEIDLHCFFVRRNNCV